MKNPTIVIRNLGEACLIREQLRREIARCDRLARKYKKKNRALHYFFEECSRNHSWLLRIVKGHIADYSRVRMNRHSPQTFTPWVNKPRVEMTTKISELLKRQK